MINKSIEITDFRRENENGLYMDYIEGCFIEKREHSFLVSLYPKPNKYCTYGNTRISEIYLQDFSDPFRSKSKIYHIRFGNTEIQEGPKDDLFGKLYHQLLKEIGTEIEVLESKYPPIYPYLPNRALKAFNELTDLGAHVSDDLGYGNHVAFVLHWRNEDTYEVFAKFRGPVLEEDGSLNGYNLNHHGIRQDVHDILKKYTLSYDWYDGGIVSVYKNYFEQGSFHEILENNEGERG